jgi:hypothetical protein
MRRNNSWRISDLELILASVLPLRYSFRPKLREEKPRKLNLTQMAFKKMLTIVVRGSSTQMFRAV